jgi:hypothetical protein
MALYTIHAPGRGGGAAVAPAELVFIKEGFCWPALFVALIWTLYRRLWLVFLLLLAGLLVLGVLGDLLGGSATVLFILARVFYALEANGLRRWTLERNGYTLVGVIEGRNLDEAERRFFSEWEPGAGTTGAPPATAPKPSAPSHVMPGPDAWKAARRDRQVVGLFPTPGSGR